MEDLRKPAQPPMDLGGGLFLRRGTAADSEALALFNARIHSDDGPEKPDEGVGYAVRDLMNGKHPVFQPEDFTIVEERATGRILSCMCLISQTWTYDGIPFKVGRPELVATELGYRDRGLIRRQFEVIHEWSRQRGEIVQAITGIPVYYRRFGYEMALDMDGSRTLYEALLPRLKEGEEEPFKLREATIQDIDFLSTAYDQNFSGSLVQCVRDKKSWRYEIGERHPKSVERFNIYILDTPSSQPVGMILTFPQSGRETLNCKSIDLDPGIDRNMAVRSIVRQLWQTGKVEAEKAGKTLKALQLNLGRSHIVYDLLGDRLQRVREPYAWYLRVPDIPGFLHLIQPVLEKRLASSCCSGYTGKLKLMLDHTGLEMQFEAGRMTSMERQPGLTWSQCDAVYPGLTFLQLLFGYRSHTDLEHSFADCFATESAAPLIKSLFPVQASNVWPVM